MPINLDITCVLQFGVRARARMYWNCHRSSRCDNISLNLINDIERTNIRWYHDNLASLSDRWPIGQCLSSTVNRINTHTHTHTLSASQHEKSTIYKWLGICWMAIKHCCLWNNKRLSACSLMLFLIHIFFSFRCLSFIRRRDKVHTCE